MFKRIVTWLGIMAVLTMLAMGDWLIAFGGTQTTVSLKWLQFMQTTGMFLLPPILCAWLWADDHKPASWLRLDKGADWKLFVLAIGIMLCAVPGINLLGDLNGRIDLPEYLDSIEQKMKQMEETAASLTERFLQADSIGGLFINLGLMALLPALSEEFTFRGTLQQILENRESRIENRKHMAIWITAFIFSAIHMQFYGFIPRMLMGAMFGYVFVWTGSLWLPIMMHFTNNSMAVLLYFIMGQNSSADTIGAGTTWWLGAISILITSLGLLIFYRRTHTQ